MHEPQIIAHRARGRQRIGARQFFPQRAARQFEHGLQLGKLGAAQAPGRGQPARIGGEQGADRPEAPDQFPCEIHRTCAPHAGAQKDRQKLGVGERAGSLGEQPLARAFRCGPVGDRHGFVFFA